MSPAPIIIARSSARCELIYRAMQNTGSSSNVLMITPPFDDNIITLEQGHLFIVDANNTACLSYFNKLGLAQPGSGNIALLELPDPVQIGQLLNSGFSRFCIASDAAIGLGMDILVNHATPGMLRQLVIVHGPGQIRDPDALSVLVDGIASLAPLATHKKRLYTVLAELTNNIVEHGILKLDSQQKHNIDGFERYYDNKAKSLATLEHGDITYAVGIDAGNTQTMEIIIYDSTPGFDYQARLDAQTSNLAPHGKGIALVQMLCKQLEYYPPGNKVRLIYDLSGD